MEHHPSGPSIALLGAGYSLQALARLYDPREVLCITEDHDHFTLLSRRYPFVHLLDLGMEESWRLLCNSYKNVEVVVDGLPPGESARAASSFLLRYSPPALRRIVALGTTGVYQFTDGRAVDESSSEAPSRRAASSCLEREELYVAADFEFVACRIPAIYGPGRGIGCALKAGTYKLVGNGVQWSNRIHVVDLARSLKRLVEMEEPPRVIILSDDTPAQIIEVVQYYCETFELAFPEVILPEEAGLHRRTRSLSSKRLDNSLMRTLLPDGLCYPGFVEGAVTEFGVTFK